MSSLLFSNFCINAGPEDDEFDMSNNGTNISDDNEASFKIPVMIAIVGILGIGVIIGAIYRKKKHEEQAQ